MMPTSEDMKPPHPDSPAEEASPEPSPSGPETVDVPVNDASVDEENSSPDSAPDGGRSAGTPLGQLLEQLEMAENRAHEAEEKLKGAEDRILRTMADMDNLRRRLQRDKEEAIKRSTSALLEGFLPVWDNFRMGLQSVEGATDPAAFVQGFAMVGDQFRTFLEQNGVEFIEADGQTFDPNLHECISQQVSPDVPEQTVITTVRPGFRIGQYLVRPASVVISSGPESSLGKESGADPVEEKAASPTDPNVEEHS